MNFKRHSANIEKLIEKGKQLHLKGDYPKAAEIYRAVLDRSPGNFDATHLLAIAESQRGNPLSALELYNTCVRLKPNVATVLNNRGITQRQLGQLEAALESYDQAIALSPQYAEAFNNRGLVLSDQGRLDEALISYNSAIQLNDTYIAPYINKGLLYIKLTRFRDALAVFSKAEIISPDLIAVYTGKGAAYIGLHEFEEAFKNYEKAIDIDSKSVEAWNGMGIAAAELKMANISIECYRNASSLDPLAIESYYNLGCLYSAAGNFQEAEKNFRRVIELRPNYAKAHLSMGNLYREREDYLIALSYYQSAVDFDKNLTDAIYNRGLTNLTLKRFNIGFPDLRHRWKSTAFDSENIDLPLPRYERFSDYKYPFFYAEQGLGDEIFFLSVLYFLQLECKSIALAADLRLHEILKRSFAGISLVQRKSSYIKVIPEKVDSFLPIGDTFQLFTNDQIIQSRAKGGFLKPNLARCDQIKASLLVRKSKKLVGIAFKSANKRFGLSKSINLETFLPILEIKSLKFINLQYGDVDSELLELKRNYGIDISQESIDLTEDIDGLTSLIDACDIVITVSNVTAHLTGAIGKCGAVLVPKGNARQWYWHPDDYQSIWYPSLTLFHQSDSLSWKGAIEECRNWIIKQIT